MITEIYVPRAALPRFVDDVRTAFGEHRASVVYGTIRLIERDDESFLAWAGQSWACVIFNLHVVHTAEGSRERPTRFAGSSTLRSARAAATT